MRRVFLEKFYESYVYFFKKRPKTATDCLYLWNYRSKIKKLKKCILNFYVYFFFFASFLLLILWMTIFFAHIYIRFRLHSVPIQSKICWLRRILFFHPLIFRILHCSYRYLLLFKNFYSLTQEKGNTVYEQGFLISNKLGNPVEYTFRIYTSV